MPSTWGMTRLRPPWRLGSSFTLTRVLEAYRSWNAAGNGGRDGARGGRGFGRDFFGGGDAERSASESESEYCTSDMKGGECCQGIAFEFSDAEDAKQGGSSAGDAALRDRCRSCFLMAFFLSQRFVGHSLYCTLSHSGEFIESYTRPIHTRCLCG